MQNQADESDKIAKTPGFTCWLTGLSGSGKSTIAKELLASLNSLELSSEILDGDIIRKHLCSDLGFSAKDRETNVLRVAYLCNLLNKHGINTIVALISPCNETRNKVRNSLDNFVEVYVNCPLDECIKRDPKGLYQKALAGDILEFTGISSPYDSPKNPELILKTNEEDVQQSVQKILAYLGSVQLIEY
jgi:adenylyl-sulfate kinase